MAVAMPRTPPYQRDHERSVSSRLDTGKPPTTLRQLLGWYQRGWEQEVPDELHTHDVWRDFGEQGQGGSALGAPRYTDAFRRYIEQYCRETDQDGMFTRPIAAALHRLYHGGGTVRSSGKPILTLWLYRLARSGFDIGNMADQQNRDREEVLMIVGGALSMLWLLYSEAPQRRVRA